MSSEPVATSSCKTEKRKLDDRSNDTDKSCSKTKKFAIYLNQKPKTPTVSVVQPSTSADDHIAESKHRTPMTAAIGKKTDALRVCKLFTLPKPSSTPSAEQQTKSDVKSVFGGSVDDESDDDEMPFECRLRMRNVGRDTPTSAGPNSFRKTKQGFMDGRKVAERRAEEMLRDLDEDTPK